MTPVGRGDCKIVVAPGDHKKEKEQLELAIFTELKMPRERDAGTRRAPVLCSLGCWSDESRDLWFRGVAWSSGIFATLV